MKFYAGIGSRNASPAAQARGTKLARELEKRGYLLHSGGAVGMDKAFERGVMDPYRKVIFRPEDCTPEAEEMASQFHPAWHLCSPYVRKLHGRNCQIILGEKLDQIASFVVAYTADEENGGTSLGLRVARSRGIQVINLAKGPDQEALVWEIVNYVTGPKGLPGEGF
jgi:hypothetical protein